MGNDGQGLAWWQEGPLALYKGFAATFARQCPYVVITWLTVERLPLDPLFYHYSILLL